MKRNISFVLLFVCLPLLITGQTSSQINKTQQNPQTDLATKILQNDPVKTGQLRRAELAQNTEPFESAGLGSVWSDPVSENPYLNHRHVFFAWDDLEPCGDDNYFWEINPVATDRYYTDSDKDGQCEANEGVRYNRFKEKFMVRLYKTVDPNCKDKCDLKQPLELIHPQARVYVHINGFSQDTLKEGAGGKYDKGNLWLFDHIALLTAPDGDYNVNGRKYPSVQFWAPTYQSYYEDMLKDFATELKKYDEIYPYVSFVRAQFNAFNHEDGSVGSGDSLCKEFDSTEACVDYIYDHRNYDAATRYNQSLKKTFYQDGNTQKYYFAEANDYHAWVAATYHKYFKDDPKLNAEIVMKPFPTDKLLSPESVYDAFLDKMINDYGVWYYKTNVMPTGHSQQGDLTRLVYEEKATRGYTEAGGRYTSQAEGRTIIPAQYDNPLQWTYWHALLDLHRGIDVISLYGEVVARCEGDQPSDYCDIYQFINEFAGRANAPATTKGAWIAFRPRFHPSGLSGNLEMHITQLEPDQSSNRLFGYDTCDGSDSKCSTRTDLNPPKPGWLNCNNSNNNCPDDGHFGSVRNGKVVNLGPKTQPYGLWARSIGANDKHTITLDIDDAFVAAIEPDSTVDVSIIYFDKGNDSFALTYKNAAGNNRSKQINKGDSKQWKTANFTLTDFSFNNKLSQGDLQLNSNNDGEDILHMVKLDTAKTEPGPEPDNEDFTLTAEPKAQAIDPGGEATYNLTIGVVDGFDQEVTLSASSTSPNLDLQISKMMLTPPGTAKLTVTEGSGSSLLLLVDGQHTITIKATGGGLTHTAEVQLLIGGHAVYLPLVLK